MRKYCLIALLVAFFAARSGLPSVKATQNVDDWIAEKSNFRWKQHTFTSHGHETFVQFSGYRTAKDKFSTVGFLLLKFRQIFKNQTCRWYGHNGKIIYGQIQVGYEAPEVKTANRHVPYETIALLCNLEGPTDNKGGHVVTKMLNETFVLYEEKPHTFTESSMDPKEPFRHKISFCSLRLYDKIDSSYARDFIDYYRVRFGMDFFHFYDSGGIDSSFIEMLQPYFHLGIVSVTNMGYVHHYKPKHHGQFLSIADCTYRSRLDAKWIFFGDIDEYFDPIFPNTMDSLLSKYSNEAWMSHQGYEWDLGKCKKEHGGEGEGEEGGENDFIVGKMVVREKYPFGKKVLTAGQGHRKLILDPRLVDFPSVHYVDHGPPGIDLDPFLDARHHHYRGLGSRKVEKLICTNSTLVKREANDTMVDEYMSRIIGFVRKCLSGTPKECVYKLQQHSTTIP